eukprot:3722933-Karenia_brevis.AAC.1
MAAWRASRQDFVNKFCEKEGLQQLPAQTPKMYALASRRAKITVPAWEEADFAWARSGQSFEFR